MTQNLLLDYFKRLLVASAWVTLGMIILTRISQALIPILGEAVVYSLIIFAPPHLFLACGDRWGLFRYKLEDLWTYLKAKGGPVDREIRESAAAAAALPMSILSAALIGSMLNAAFPGILLWAALCTSAVSLVLITIASSSAQVGSAVRESFLTCMAMVIVLGMTADNGPLSPCRAAGNATATECRTQERVKTETP